MFWVQNNMCKKILIVTHHRKDRSPGQRFRFEQYLDFISANNIQFEWDILLSKEDDLIFYSNRNISKIVLIIKLFFKRLKTVRKAKNYDAIFIFRETFVVGGAFFERWIHKRNPNIIFDFDDAIWLKNVSNQNKKFEWLKKPEKTNDIIKISKVIITGNSYLSQYTRKINPKVVVIPTTIDTSYHFVRNNNCKDVVTIGWTGSSTTLPYFEEILPELEKLKLEFGDRINFQVIVDINKYYSSINTQTTPWSIEKEIEDLSKIDIGLMPLPDTEWAKGKCGFKALQYMSLEIPAIVSAVGVNKEIIKDNENGFLIYNNEWIDKIKILLNNPEIRVNIGRRARKTIEQEYSVESNKLKYLKIFKDI
ncbi:MAG: glycosyltransferase [Flavobacteriales bacterium]|nr:glycosyltransferase [Flavobacteriales bacterium]